MDGSSIFLALDGMSVEKARATAAVLAPHVGGGKANDLIDEAGGGVLDGMAFRHRFLDAKIKDIENADQNRVAKYQGHAEFLTVHTDMSFAGLRAAAKVGRSIGVAIIGVTVLTDISARQCKKLYGAPPSVVVPERADRARRAGLEGVVCSPKEVALVRRVWPNGTIIVPGVRSAGAATHDQKRTGTPRQAILDGADWLVCGRQILNQPTVEAQIEEAERINVEVEEARRYLRM